ncbi:MAG: GNAT family N-acetyltransferase [Clostridiales bacterium]|nr:GNAT family N-acetyltransferase [Clostridiales bacterium]
MNIVIKEFTEKDITSAIEIWNEVVDDGLAFPQLDDLTAETGTAFFKSQSYTGIAFDKDTGEAVGLYILHPNNEGRCGHICNASYAVKSAYRGHGIGESLVKHCIKTAPEKGFKILQFNAVVASNKNALALYKKLGFTQLGTIPGGFLLKNGTYEDIIPHYLVL